MIMNSKTEEQTLAGELQSKQIQLHWLLQITKAINYNLPPSKLFEIYRSVLRDHLRVGKLLLFTFDSHWHQTLSFGVDHHQVIINPDSDFMSFNAFDPSLKNAPAWASDFETIIPVIHNEKALAYAFVGDFSAMQGNPKEILPFIHTITNIIVVAIENKRLTQETLRQAAFKKELELAAEMQRMLFPQKPDGYGIFDVETIYLPNAEVGGDYYDYIRISEQETLICIADVSGKGMPAALVMSNFQAHLHAMARHTKSLKEIVAALNREIYRNTNGEKFITVFSAIINHLSGEMTYVNAGHNPPLFFTHDGSCRQLHEGTTIIGGFSELPFLSESKVVFSKGDSLFCFTDGITELENPDGEIFGIERFHKIISSQLATQPLAEINKTLVDEWNAFRREHPFTDDITMLSLRKR